MGNSKKSASLSSVSCSNKFLNLRRMSQDTAEEVREAQVMAWDLQLACEVGKIIAGLSP